MPWARFDDRFPSNRKVRLLSDGAFRLYVSAICWSAENLTDGVIKTAELRLVADVRATRARAKELVEAGLFDVVDGVGWKIHDYHEYNPTAEQVRADRAQRTARQQRWRQKKQGATPDPDPPGSTPDVDASTNASRDASRDGTRDAAPSRPVPARTRSSGSGRERSDRSSARDEAAHSLITPDWHPSHADLDSAKADLDRLGPASAATATAKFVRHHTAKATHAADFGPLWVTWLARERTQPPTQGTFLVGLPGGGATPPTPTPPSFQQRMAALDAAAEADRHRDRQGDAG
ncbi:hypothetical protein [Streptomyces sp. Je 1-369]|uniref:hypothetical protein n=1 Tax=Streptomyces sp. Je 1-369 TaxID=2966192 RepID=UPI002285903E|nr:hypothetical protein [Streptomyces sp. Je 1-369]WAL93943.1 hypothetical protein NOO62_05190 [Streptomyces sp. Je 1-369]